MISDSNQFNFFLKPYTTFFFLMRPFSLRFVKEELEQDYQRLNTKINMKVFGRNFLFYGLVVFAFGTYSFILGQKLLGALCLLYSMLIIPLIYLLARRYSNYFDIFCFTLQAAILFCQPVLVLLDLNKEPIQDIENTQTGQTIAYVSLIFNLGSRFDLKCIAILINVLAQTIVINERHSFTPLTIVWGLSNFLIMNYIYMHDCIEREAFLIKHNEKLWQKEIGSCAKICIMSCISDDGQLHLDYNKCNTISKQEFCISDQVSYKKFLNSVKLIEKGKFNQQVLNYMKTPSKSKKFITLHNKIYQISEKTQNVNYEEVGLLNNCVYDIKIFTTWNNQLLNIHVLMTKSFPQADTQNSQSLKYEREIFAQYRKKFQTSIKIILIKLNLQNQIKHSQVVDASIMSNVQNALRMSYNIQFFLNPSYKYIKTEFHLASLIEQIKTITISSMPNQFKLIIRSYVCPEIKLISCQKTIFHILLNLLSIIVTNTKKSGYILVSTKLKPNSLGTNVSFCIATNIQSIRNFLDNQNYQKRLYGEEKGFKFQSVKFGLELSVSEFLVGRIGPRRKIKVEELSDDRLSIRFNIFLDLTHMSSI